MRHDEDEDLAREDAEAEYRAWVLQEARWARAPHLDRRWVRTPDARQAMRRLIAEMVGGSWAVRTPRIAAVMAA